MCCGSEMCPKKIVEMLSEGNPDTEQLLKDFIGTLFDQGFEDMTITELFVEAFSPLHPTTNKTL